MSEIHSPFKFTYGAAAVGGDSDVYRVDGPYSLSKTFEGLVLSLSVVVVATSLADLQDKSDALEVAFRKRDQTLLIDLDNIDDPGGASTWTYTNGEDLLNVVSAIEKVGDEETDNGVARMYAVTVTGELPSDDTNGGELTGLQDITYSVAKDPSRRQVVTVSGTYTATPAQASPVRAAQTARENYADATTGAEIEAEAFLTGLTGTFEMTVPNTQEDRNNHSLKFTLIYQQILANQSEGTLDDTEVVDHTLQFSEVIDGSGDSREGLFRLREVTGIFNCAVDFEQGTDVQTVFENTVKPFIRAEFVRRFSPAQYCVGTLSYTVDPSNNRISSAFTFLYKKAGGDNLVEFLYTVRVEERHNHDFTPVHGQDPYSRHVADGWTDKTRTKTAVSVVLGGDPPERSLVPEQESNSRRRKAGKGSGGTGGNGQDPIAEAGPSGGRTTVSNGGGGRWVNVYDDVTHSTKFVGDPSFPQLQMSSSTEVIVDQYITTPGRR